MIDRAKIAAIVLASGFSRRMGEQKLLLPLKEKTILEQTLSNILKSRARKQDIYVVVPNNDRQRINMIENHSVQLVLNDRPDLGMGSSLAKGIRSIHVKEYDAVMILLGDQPEIKSEDINLLHQQFVKRSHMEGAIPKVIIKTAYRDQRKGHPILFSKHYFSVLAKLTGDIGGKNIIEKNQEDVRLVHSPNNYPNDIDTPIDYHRLLERQNSD
jgi:molybdenum cofactor cytidylyltransferase